MIHTLLLTSSVLILGIFCVRKLTFGRIAMRARYALWLLAALRLLFPFTLGESPVSVMNVFSGAAQIRQMQTGLQGREEVRTDSAGDGTDSDAAPALENDGLFAGGNAVPEGGGADAYGSGGQVVARRREETINHAGRQHTETADPVSGKKAVMGDGLLTGFLAAHPDFLNLFFGGVWFFGFAAVGGYMLLSRKRFLRYLRKRRSLLSEEVLPEEFVNRLTARRIKVYQVQGLPSPCLVGSDIYIDERAAADSQGLSHILAHEYIHALHGDGVWAFLRSFLAAVYWFDPLVWAAAYGARQDSELACDEAAVALLGERERFAYGRTLLNLLEKGEGGDACPGMAFMLDRGEKGVRERIGALAGSGRPKKAAAVLAVLAAIFLCSCAFTGAAENGEDSAAAEAAGGQNAAGQDSESAGMQNAPAVSGQDMENADAQNTAAAEQNAVTQGASDGTGQAADEADFEDALHYRGIMEGKDDSELALNRQVDYQAYYQFAQGGAENPMENGWYLLCKNEDAGAALYGLYTEEFGFRGIKTLIGEDVNTFDGKWCASASNSAAGNIRVLERAQDGLPARFVWKLPVEESSTAEIWRFYYAHRYETGTVEVKTLTEEDCLAWAEEYLTMTVNQEKGEVYVTYDGDMYLGSIDISAYQGWQVEDVRIVPNAVAFLLDDPDADIYQAYSDAVWEKTAVNLAVGLKFEGVEGLLFDGLPLLTIQIAEDGNNASGFRLGYPRINERYAARAPWQKKELSKLQNEVSPAQAAGSEETDGSAGEGWNDLEKPLVNEGEAHHDLAIDFRNPCPDFERISDSYGERVHPVTGKVRTHTGVDLAAAEGSAVLAAADGTVFMTGFDAVNGNYVVLWHGQSGQMTYYAHCKTVEVEEGQAVSQGEKIATVGQTGQATGPFLHFAISSGDNWEEPYFIEID